MGCEHDICCKITSIICSALCVDLGVLPCMIDLLGSGNMACSWMTKGDPKNVYFQNGWVLHVLLEMKYQKEDVAPKMGLELGFC